MPKKKKPPAQDELSWKLARAALDEIRRQRPDFRAPLNVERVRDVLLDVLNTPATSGRPPKHPARELCSLISALTHPKIEYQQKNLDTGKTELVEAEGELHKRYRARGTWPGTKSKWAPDTDARLRAWWASVTLDAEWRAWWERWERTPEAEWSGDARLDYPADAIARWLGPAPPRGGLMAFAFFLVAARCSVPVETLRDYWKDRREV